MLELIKLHLGDCLEVMKTLPENSVDSIVTDPPYELGFMGKSWDNTGIANNVDMWREALRVLKPGGHLLAFSGTRTYHRMASAIEDAGFEVRDMIEWVYGSGFPKSLNIGKAVDKLQGNEREIIGKKIDLSSGKPMSAKQAKAGNGKNINEGWDRPWRADDKHCEDMTLLTKGTSEREGYGTALKPSHEPICMARKPLEKGLTIAENCLKWGTGGIDIDGSRVETEDKLENHGRKPTTNGRDPRMSGGQEQGQTEGQQLGRFPANLIHDNSEEVRWCFPETKSQAGIKNLPTSNIYGGNSLLKSKTLGTGEITGFSDSGNASRFFKSIIYQAKASKSERNMGCEGLPLGDAPASARSKPAEGRSNALGEPRANNHPTVKPIALMEYLIKMVTREGQTVLDPFMGSGTTGVACKKTNRNFIGIEMSEEYMEICKARILSD